jgi:hypothetical protein
MPQLRKWRKNMKATTFITLIIVLLTGCASFEEAYEIDREFGKAQLAAWEKQLVHPDKPYASKTPEGLEGINAEGVMDVYNNTFSEKPTEVPALELRVTGNE